MLSAPTVPSEAAMGKAMASKAVVEAVSGMMCKGVVTETAMGESVPSKSAATVCVTTVFMAAMGGIEYLAGPVRGDPVSMGEFVGKPATAVVPMSVVESVVPSPAKSACRP